jgi:hypothetical protein
MIQIKRLGVPMIFYYTKLHLCECNVSRIVSIRQNINFNYYYAMLPHATVRNATEIKLYFAERESFSPARVRSRDSC